MQSRSQLKLLLTGDSNYEWEDREMRFTVHLHVNMLMAMGSDYIAICISVRVCRTNFIP